MPRNVSTKDIAKMLGIARSTVIRALNNDPKIKRETIEKVHNLARRLGYQKNSIARSLVSGRTNIIGCIMPNLIDPFYGEMITYINSFLDEAGMSMLLGVTNDSDILEMKHVNTFMNYRVDGVLLNTSRTGFYKNHIIHLRESMIPLVILGNGQSIGVDSVMADDELGAYLLISELHANGYERIALIGDLEHKSLNWRIEGYKRALLEHNLRYDPRYIWDCGKLFEVKPAIHQLLALPDPPDAIFCCNDYIAIEAVHAITMIGKRVPEDIAVVGFDNIAIARELSCPLTTVDLRSEDVCRTGVQMLLEKIQAKAEKIAPPAEQRYIRIKPNLCIRETALHRETAQTI